MFGKTEKEVSKQMKEINKDVVTGFKPRIKTRLMHTKGNRVYIQDSELLETLFKPGEKYVYSFDDKDVSKLRIRACTLGRRTVARRKRKDGFKSVIDIKSEDVLLKLGSYACLNLEIYEDEIRIKGVTSEELDGFVNVKHNKTGFAAVGNKVINLIEKFKVKKEYRVSKKFINDTYMKKVSGEYSSEYEQLSFDSLVTDNMCGFAVESMYNASNEEVQRKDVETVMRLVSLCSGAGVLDKGFINQGFEPKFSLELEGDMVKTYAANLGEHIVQGDLSEYAEGDVVDAEVLLAGTPCQDFVRP